jgi:NADPH:quinone reductase-like Zn-dependent oxidoreductase
MKALRIHQPGGAEGLVYEDAPDPEPVTGDVLIEVRGAGFTPNELAWSATWIDRAGRDRTPSIPAHEVSGVVFDTIGGEVLAHSTSIVKPTGTLVSIVVPPPERPDGGSALFFVVEPDRAQLQDLASQVDAGLLRPHVGATYPLSDGRAAFEAKRRGIAGKVLLQA